jgi:uncharacterized protein
MRKYLLFLCVLAAILLTGCGSHPKPETRGLVRIQDDAGLFSEADMILLMTECEKLTEYGHVGIYTYGPPSYGINVPGDAKLYETSDVAAVKYESWYGTSSAFLFIIDMINREIYIETDGYIGDTVTPGKAKSITDNVYKLASKRDYSGCVTKAVGQAWDLIEGRRIAEPMKYASNAVIAVLLGLLINFIVLRMLNRKKEVSVKELTDANRGNATFNGRSVTVVSRHVTVIRHSGGEGSRGGFGGGGGHHSHGGGHRF